MKKHQERASKVSQLNKFSTEKAPFAKAGDCIRNGGQVHILIVSVARALLTRRVDARALILP